MKMEEFLQNEEKVIDYAFLAEICRRIIALEKYLKRMEPDE